MKISLVTELCLANQAKGMTPDRAAMAVRWVLATADGRYVHSRDGCASLNPDLRFATVFDGRDNEAVKSRFFAFVLGVSLTVVIL